jgi:uncharacterized protein YuzE
MEVVLEKLKYDQSTDVLYIVSDSLAEDPNDFQEFNPEITRLKK